MLRRNRKALVSGIAILAALACMLASSAGAFPSYFTNRCSSCHSNDTPTCNGCHNHRGNLGASANAGIYAPGDPVTVTLTGGTEGGWIRGILYDQDDAVIDMASGPTNTGDDSQGNPVTFPVALQGTAPQQAGDYIWEAAWFGGQTAGGGAHLEIRRAVTIHVEIIPTGVPDESAGGEKPLTTWSALRALY